MTMIQTISPAQDEAMARLIAGLEREFGCVAGEALAARFLAAEEGDFLWQARINERWLGTYEGLDEDGGHDLDRVAIAGRLGRKWFAAVVVVDGDGCFEALIGRRDFARRRQALDAFLALR